MFKRKKKFKNKTPENPPLYEGFEGSHNNSELFKIFKNHEGRLLTKWIHYFEVYEEYLEKYRDKEINILEIGIHRGGSLQMWKEYFGIKANIYGVDINPECKDFEEDKIKVFIGDQSNRKFLKELVSKTPEFDIIIDDGGHSSKQQITSFEELYGHVKGDGVYIVEDTHTNFWPKYQRGVRKSFLEYSKKLVDQLHAWHFEEDRSMRRFAIPPKKREGIFDVAEFTATTKSINFYNSMVVFKKNIIAEPYHCYSGKIK